MIVSDGSQWFAMLRVCDCREFSQHVDDVRLSDAEVRHGAARGIVLRL
jgi:hypothetical protein